jgi:type I restriction enzyme R subunit
MTMLSGIARDKTAMAETVENNIRKVIIDEQPTNPKYYDKMSDLLDALIRERRAQALDYQQYLARIVDLAKQVQNPTAQATYPSSLNTRAKQSLYDNLGNDEQLALAMDADIQRTKKDGWRGNLIKEREILAAIRRHVQDSARVDAIFELVKNQNEY